MEQGLTKVICTVKGPREPEGRNQVVTDNVLLNVDITLPPFSTHDRKKRPRNDKRLQEICISLRRLFNEAVLGHLYSRTVIDINLYVVAEDGGLISACVNAATLALIDAGISMYDYVTCCSTAMYGETPLLDPIHAEESDIPFVIVGVIGKETENLSLLLLENKMPLDGLESAIAVSLAGSKSIRSMMDAEVRRQGAARQATNLQLH